MPDSVTIKFKYSADEYERAVWAHYASRTSLAGDLIAFVLVAIGGGWFIWDGKDPGVGYFALTLEAIWAAMVLYLNFWGPRMAFRSNPKFAEEFELTFSPEGIHFRTPSIDSRLQWSFYSNALVSRDFFLLYYGKHDFTTIPKRVFTDSSSVQTFESLLVRFVPNIKRCA